MMTILTVEDNAQVREILTPMIEMWLEHHPQEMQIIEKCNGAEALEWIKSNGVPDLVLLDVRMPVMDGAELLRQTAHLGIDLRPRTLLLTGYADDLEDHLGSDALLMKHLRKPFMASELFAALDQLVESI